MLVGNNKLFKLDAGSNMCTHVHMQVLYTVGPISHRLARFMRDSIILSTSTVRTL